MAKRCVYLVLPTRTCRKSPASYLLNSKHFANLVAGRITRSIYHITRAVPAQRNRNMKRSRTWQLS